MYLCLSSDTLFWKSCIIRLLLAHDVSNIYFLFPGSFYEKNLWYRYPRKAIGASLFTFATLSASQGLLLNRVLFRYGTYSRRQIPVASCKYKVFIRRKYQDHTHKVKACWHYIVKWIKISSTHYTNLTWFIRTIICC